MALSRGFIRNAATTPLDARLMDQARLVQNADGSTRAGVLGAIPALVTATSTTSPMTVAIAAAPIVASRGIGDGAVVYSNDGVVNVTVAAAPGANSRIDVFWTRHQDDTVGDAAGSNAPIFGVTSGAAAASPTKPAIPTGAVELATLRIYAGTTSTNGGANVLTQTYQMTAMQGGAVQFRTVTDLKAWTTATDGQTATILGRPGIWQWSAAITKWAPQFSLVGRYSNGQNLASGSAIALTATPILSAAESSPFIGEVIAPRVGGGFTVLVDGVFEIDGPFTMNVGASLQKLDVRIFVDIVPTGLTSRRSTIFTQAAEDTSAFQSHRFPLKAGDTILLQGYHARGTVVTFAWLPTITYLGPTV